MHLPWLDLTHLKLGYFFTLQTFWLGSSWMEEATEAMSVRRNWISALTIVTFQGCCWQRLSQYQVHFLSNSAVLPMVD